MRWKQHKVLKLHLRVIDGIHEWPINQRIHPANRHWVVMKPQRILSLHINLFLMPLTFQRICTRNQHDIRDREYHCAVFTLWFGWQVQMDAYDQLLAMLLESSRMWLDIRRSLEN